MDEQRMSRKDVMRQIVTDTRVQTGMFQVPQEYLEHMPVEKRMDFLDIFDLEVRHLDGSTHEMMFFWSEAMDVHEALTGWLLSQHEMGRCECGEHDNAPE